MKSGGKADNLEAEISLLWDALHGEDSYQHSPDVSYRTYMIGLTICAARGLLCMRVCHL